jgi:hypothetical protein
VCFCCVTKVSPLQFDQTALDTLKADTEAAIQAAINVDMKEIRGLEERLSGLENLMFSNKKYVQEQEELSIVHPLTFTCESFAKITLPRPLRKTSRE